MIYVSKIPSVEEVLAGGPQAGVAPPPGFGPDAADGTVERVGTGGGFFSASDLQSTGPSRDAFDDLADAAAALKAARAEKADADAAASTARQRADAARIALEEATAAFDVASKKVR